MAATVTKASFGRIADLGTVSVVRAVIGGNGASYATASGGLPIDLAALLNIVASPLPGTTINPGDVVDAFTCARSTNGYTATGLVMGTATYTAITPQLANVNPAQKLATAPATIRLYAAGGAEFTDGANSDTFTLYIMIARGGVNA